VRVRLPPSAPYLFAKHISIGAINVGWTFYEPEGYRTLPAHRRTPTKTTQLAMHLASPGNWSAWMSTQQFQWW